MTQLPPVLYRGSVKNVRGEVSAPYLLFEFSDRFSVFDWGEMPDALDEKGKTLAVMGKSFFSFLGNPSAWEGLFSSPALLNNFDNEYLEKLSHSYFYKKLKTFGLFHHAVFDQEIELNSPYMKVKNIQVLRPPFNGSYDYSAYEEKPVNTLVPLEVIFRLGLPPGNSLSKRLGSDLSKWETYGLSEVPQMGLLKKPIIDFSTKLERGDRYIDYSEAKNISSMNEGEFGELCEMTALIALNLFKFHAEMGLTLLDGKIEVAFVTDIHGKRSFMLVDSIGIDELRLLYKGKSFSKEFLREFYKKSSWYDNLEAAKRDVSVHGGDFKSLCIEKYESKPLPLDEYTKDRAEAVYKSYANEISKRVNGQSVFPNEFNLSEYSSRYM